MKRMQFFLIAVVLSLVLPNLNWADERHHSRHGEIRVVNDTDSQISFIISTEKFGKKTWTFKPHQDSFCSVEGIRIRVTGSDRIMIGDWGETSLRNVGEFRDGYWFLSLREARHEMRRR